MKAYTFVLWDPRFITIVVLILALVGLLLFIPSEERVIDIPDKCGRFMNLMQHTIQSEGVCKSRCVSQCEAVDFKLKKVEFRDDIRGCNRCTCYCKG